MRHIKLTEQEQELVDKLKDLPKDRFQNCMVVLERENFIYNTDEKAISARKEALENKELYLKQGRIKAEYFARMRLATATLELENAKKELLKIYENWEELEHDVPIYWDREDGKKVLVGEVARDYSNKDEKVEYTRPDGTRFSR